MPNRPKTQQEKRTAYHPTVKALIEMLSQFDPNAEVWINYAPAQLITNGKDVAHLSFVELESGDMKQVSINRYLPI